MSKTLQEKIEVMAAYARGEKIACTPKRNWSQRNWSRMNRWEPCNDPCWDWASLDYEVLAKPPLPPKPSQECLDKHGYVLTGECRLAKQGETYYHHDTVCILHASRDHDSSCGWSWILTPDPYAEAKQACKAIYKLLNDASTRSVTTAKPSTINLIYSDYDKAEIAMNAIREVIVNMGLCATFTVTTRGDGCHEVEVEVK